MRSKTLARLKALEAHHGDAVSRIIIAPDGWTPHEIERKSILTAWMKQNIS